MAVSGRPWMIVRAMNSSPAVARNTGLLSVGASLVGPWQPAQLDSATKEKYGWKLFTYTWTGATPGDHVIVSRATDATGRVQPTEEELATKKSFLEHNAQTPRKVRIA